MEGTTKRAGLRAPVGEEAAATLRALLRRSELFARRANEAHLSVNGLASGVATWFGVEVGVGRTSAVPADVLLLVYAQELVRRALGWEHSLVIVSNPSDATPGVTSLDGRRATDRALDRLSSIAGRLGFPVALVAAHQLARAECARIRSTLDIDDPGVREQVVLTELMRRRRLTARIGWAGSTGSPRCDQTYAASFGDGVTFVHTVDGRTLDTAHRRACPSTAAEPARRILLEPGEDVAGKLATAPSVAARRYRRLLEKLARAHTRLTGDPAASGIELVQSLIDSL